MAHPGAGDGNLGEIDGHPDIPAAEDLHGADDILLTLLHIPVCQKPHDLADPREGVGRSRVHCPSLARFGLTRKSTMRYKHRMARQRNPLFDALAVLDSPDIQQLTAPGKVAKALAVIRKVSPNVTAEEIIRRARNLQMRWPRVTIKSTTLAFNWGLAENPPNAIAKVPAKSGADREATQIREELQTLLDPDYRKYLETRLNELTR